MTLTIYGVVGYSLLPGGQLIARIFNYDGSLDQPWFLFPLFLIFPFQIIPLLLMYYGYIKKGKGGKVYDNYIWIPIIIRFIIEISKYMILKYIINNSSTNNIICNVIGELIIIISIMITKYLHTNDSCKILEVPEPKYNPNLFTLLCDSIFENGIAFMIKPILNLLILILNIIPGIAIVSTLIDILIPEGMFTRIWTSICWLFGYSFIYIIQNMFQQFNLSGLCNNIVSLEYLFKVISGLFLIIINYYLYKKK